MGICPHLSKVRGLQYLPSVVMVLLMQAMHAAMFRNFGGTCVSNNLRLGPSAGCGGLNHHDVDGNGGPDIGTSS